MNRLLIHGISLDPNHKAENIENEAHINLQTSIGGNLTLTLIGNNQKLQGVLDIYFDQDKETFRIELIHHNGKEEKLKTRKRKS